MRGGRRGARWSTLVGRAVARGGSSCCCCSCSGRAQRCWRAGWATGRPVAVVVAAVVGGPAGAAARARWLLRLLGAMRGSAGVGSCDDRLGRCGGSVPGPARVCRSRACRRVSCCDVRVRRGLIGRRARGAARAARGVPARARGPRAARSGGRRAGDVVLVSPRPVRRRGPLPWPRADADELSLWDPIAARRRRAGRGGGDRAGRAQRAGRRRARGGQVGRAVGADRGRRAGSGRAGLAARRQARRARRVGAGRASAVAGPDGEEAIALLRRPARGDGGALPRAARARAAQGRSARTGCRCTWSCATSWRSTSRCPRRRSARSSPSCCAISSPAAARPA